MRKSVNELEILDSTLRERTFGVSFSVGEKLAIASLLDKMGMAYIESRFPKGDSNEAEFLQKVRTVTPRGSELVLYLSDSDSALSSPEVASIDIDHYSLHANCWKSNLEGRFSSRRKFEPEEYLRQLKSRLSTVKSSGKDAFFYAQHFFDGFFEDSAFALSVLEASIESGVASKVVLCDSRGGSFPDQVSKAVKIVCDHFSTENSQRVTVGIHCHNDLGLAVSNTLTAVESGATHVQGSVNGLGERSGCANLCQLLPILTRKLGYSALRAPASKEQQLLLLKMLSDKVSEASGMETRHDPFVGSIAFAHSDPEHVSDVNRNPESYEVINPTEVGNSRRLGVDDTSLILNEMWELGLYTKEREEVAKRVLSRMRELEAFGCKFDEAKASLHLLMLENLGFAIWPFQVVRWETSTNRTISGSAEVSGTIEVSVRDNKEKVAEGEQRKITASAKGVGPIHAMDLALRQALESEFPELKEVKLISYALNIVDSLNGTAAFARSRTEFSDEGIAYTGTTPSTTWVTTAVSEDVLDASIKALIDGYRYKLIFRSRSERYTLPDWKLALSWRYSERC